MRSSAASDVYKRQEQVPTHLLAIGMPLLVEILFPSE
jgi:hypothetical protein